MNQTHDQNKLVPIVQILFGDLQRFLFRNLDDLFLKLHSELKDLNNHSKNEINMTESLQSVAKSWDTNESQSREVLALGWDSEQTLSLITPL